MGKGQVKGVRSRAWRKGRLGGRGGRRSVGKGQVEAWDRQGSEEGPGRGEANCVQQSLVC